MTPAPALDRWRAELAGWAIPPEILERAPEPPWGLPPEMFKADDGPADTPSRRRALEGLPAGGSVLDIGCGGGAASLALVPPAAEVTGVDSSPAMLAQFAESADARGVRHREVEGIWPDVAARVGPHDVVVCHHVFYNVAELATFAHTLTDHAHRRVVVELTERHPLVGTAALWRHFHDIDRPSGPTAALAVEVLRDAGIEPSEEHWSRAPRDVPREVFVRLNRRRLCLPASAEPEVDRVMGDTVDLRRDVVTLWWDTA